MESQLNIEHEKGEISYKSTVKACYIGYFIQAIVVNLTPLLFIPLREGFGFSYTQIGLLIVTNFITQFIFDIIFSKPVDKYGFRPFAITAHIFCVVGFVLFALTPTIFVGNELAGFLIGTIIFSAAGGLLELILSPIIDSIPSDDKASAMSLLHSFYAWGQVTVILITTIFLFIFGKQNWSIIVLLWAIVPLVNILMFIKVPLVKKVEESKIMKIRSLIKNPIFIFAFFAIMMGAASEVTMNQWTSTFMEKGLMIPKIIGDTAGMCMFAIMLGIGRVIFGIYGSKIDVSKILIRGAFFTTICYIIAAISPFKILSILACVLCGIFVSLLWPGTLVIASEKLPLAGASMFALLAASGDIGAAVGPWIMAKITDILTVNSSLIQINSMTPEQLGLKVGMLIAAIFPILTVILHKSLKNAKISN